MSQIPRLGQLTALPKLGEILDDEHPCIRPLTEDEIQGICGRLGVNRKYLERFNNFDYDQLAKTLPARSVAKLLLVRDVGSLESIDLAATTAVEILNDADSTTEEKLYAIRAVCDLQNVRAMVSEFLMRQAEKAEEETKKEKPRNLPPPTLSL